MCISIRHSVLLFVFLLLTACGKKDTSLDELDVLINNHLAVQEQYQARLDSIRAEYHSDQMTDEERFGYCGQFFDMYRGFNLDSQYVYVQQRVELASRLTNRTYTQAARMNMAEVLMRSGMYHEAVLCLDSVSALPVEAAYQPYHYHLCRTLYGLMEDFALTDSEKNRYHQLTQDYRDSIMRVEEKGSFIHELVRADALYADGLYEQALTLLENYESTAGIEANQVGIVAITRAQIYRALGNHAKEKQQLIISASADLKGAVREYIALRELAVLLYYEGDIEHAYHYMACAIKDANESNMRIRSFEISTIYPIIERTWQKHEQQHRRLLYALIASIALLAAVLSLFLIYVARKRAQLEQSNRIKTVYIGRYMKMTTLADFDDAFLELFPDFVEQVKALLVPEAELRIKPKERLNTDLRVLALIHLGITESRQIAEFLHYSLPTIYNSRTRMRNLAKGNRDDFEQKIANI